MIYVSDKMQINYSYELNAKEGEDFDPFFTPELTPVQMLQMGVFEGKYLTDCQKEFPFLWFKKAKLSPEKPNPKINYFGLKSRQSLSVWRQKGWILEPDPRGWFQWYCRYYLGRRLPEIDAIQIKRWRSFRRHKAQIEHNCHMLDFECRAKQRQALLQWAYNPMF